MSDTLYIPRLNLHQFTKGSSADRKEFAAAIGSAFTETGFVTIANHGLNQALVDELYTMVKQFFTLPDEIKKQYERPDLSGQRGYTAKGREKAKDAHVPDLKEFWQSGQTAEGTDPGAPVYSDNVSVSELPRFNDVLRTVYQRLEDTGRELLKAIALYLGLEETFFEKMVYQGNSILRAIHYFPIDDPEALPADAVRAGEHEDINLITLLIGASADGLEIRTRDGSWYPVRALAADIVVNVGDMLQRLTNNKLRSTTHRVVNPPAEQMKSSRYSVPFFLHPRRDTSLAVLENCVDALHPKAYPDCTAGAYLDERLREIGLKM